jgi:hypothetical protein
MRWLATSVVLSLALTVVLNLALRAFPRAGGRLARRLDDLASPTVDDPRRDERRVRVYVPWRAMIIASVVLTIVLNLVLWLT